MHIWKGLAIGERGECRPVIDEGHNLGPQVAVGAQVIEMLSYGCKSFPLGEGCTDDGSFNQVFAKA